MKAINSELVREEIEVLHYTGYDNDRGGIMAVIRKLGDEGLFKISMGVSRGFIASGLSAIPAIEFSPLEGERLSLASLWHARKVARQVSAWLKGSGLRVFHGHSRAGLAVALWLHFFGERRIVVSVHNYGRQRWFYRLGASVLRGHLYWLSPQMRLYYGVDGTSWDQCVPGCIGETPRVEPRRTFVPGSLRLGGIGALVPWKRWDLVLDAISRLPPAKRAGVTFAHIGSGDNSERSIRCQEELRAQAARCGLESQVEWGGQLPSSDGLLGGIDCLVIASENEPFSIAMLEALARGVPVLAADSGGAKDVIVPGRNGWLFKSSDPADLSRSLLSLLEGDGIRKASLGAEDLRDFRAATIAQKWLSIYASLVRS